MDLITQRYPQNITLVITLYIVLQLFSNREGNTPTQTETISNRVWEGITAVIESFIQSDSLSKDFPLLCPDGRGICGFDENLFRGLLKAMIPTMDYPFPSFAFKQYDPFADDAEKYYGNLNESYLILDTIEFIHSHLHDAIKDPKRYHSFYQHYELLFTDEDKSKTVFRDSVNQIFERNGILFRLESDGKVYRQSILDVEGEIALASSIKEETTKDLIITALLKFHSPKIEERRFGLERLWDSFERIKTAYRSNLSKKQSAEQLIEDTADGNELFKQKLNEECHSLTDIGNQFQIRHYETDKSPVDNSKMVDYLFLRLYATVKILLLTFHRP